MPRSSMCQYDGRIVVEWSNLDGQGSADETRVVAKGRNAPA